VPVEICELLFNHILIITSLFFIRETFFLICLTPFQLLYHVKKRFSYSLLQLLNRVSTNPFKECRTLLQTKDFPRYKEIFQRNQDLLSARSMYVEPLGSSLTKNHDH